jgi:hypothetical protein
MIDALASRYGVLPSHLLMHGDTFDLTVMDVALTYEKYSHEKANNRVNHETYEKMYGADALAEKLKRARGED